MRLFWRRRASQAVAVFPSLSPAQHPTAAPGQSNPDHNPAPPTTQPGFQVIPMFNAANHNLLVEFLIEGRNPYSADSLTEGEANALRKALQSGETVQALLRGVTRARARPSGR